MKTLKKLCLSWLPTFHKSGRLFECIRVEYALVLDIAAIECGRVMVMILAIHNTVRHNQFAADGPLFTFTVNIPWGIKRMSVCNLGDFY